MRASGRLPSTTLRIGTSTTYSAEINPALAVLAPAMPSCWVALAAQSAVPQISPAEASCLRPAGVRGIAVRPLFCSARSRTSITGISSTAAIQLRPIR